MGLIDQLFQFLGASNKELELEQGKITQTNLERLNLSSIAVVVLTLFHAIYFFISCFSEDGKNIEWKDQLFMTHSLLCIFYALIYFYTRKRLKSTGEYTVFQIHLAPITNLIIMMAGAIIAAIDQKVTTSITPFILVAITAVLVQIVRPFYTLITLIFVDLVFIILMHLAQPDIAIQTSNIVNGIFVSIIAFILGTMQWKSTVTNMRQAITIENQKLDLEKNYQKVVQNTSELQAANVMKDKFFSIVAHDFKGPLSSIIGVIDLLLDKEEKMTDEEKENLLLALKQSTNNTYKMLENVLLWARNQNGTIAFMPVVIFLQPKVDAMLDFFALQAKEKKVTLINSIPKNTMVYADNDMLVTILRNVISNALKFSFPMGKIEIGLEQNDNNSALDYVVMVVKDNGVGMSKKIQSDLFRIDKSTSKPGTNNETGTGLGLILCKDLIEKNGGKIAIESDLASGTKVLLFIPKKSSPN